MIRSILQPMIKSFIVLIVINSSLTCAQEMKPDLIISRVSSRSEFRSSVTNISSTPLRYQVIIYTLTITNIGRVPFSEPFYIAYTGDVYSYPNIKYGNLSLVNTPPKEIPVGGSIEVQIETMLIDNKKTGARFLIQTDGKDHGNQQLPKIEELNYENNIFTY